VQAGDAKHRAYDLTDTIQVTVEQLADSVERFDADGDGSIDRDEAVDAIVAYNDGSTVGGEEVTRDQAVQVIVDYNTG
jgi:Ca2+-binding EF-hand superfamily protein